MPDMRIQGGVLRGDSAAPRIAPEDGVIRLGPSEGAALQPRTLRVLPPWINLRYLPPTEVES
jgi:hypothetical protein